MAQLWSLVHPPRRGALDRRSHEAVVRDSEVHKADEISEAGLVGEIDEVSEVDYDELDEVSEVGEAEE